MITLERRWFVIMNIYWGSMAKDIMSLESKLKTGLVVLFILILYL